MKIKVSVLVVLFAQAFSWCGAQEIVYVDGAKFPVYGKALENTSGRYERFPEEYRDRVSPRLWDLSRNSAGLYIRFSSDAPQICAKWRSLFKIDLHHMTPTGVRGLDLYALIGGEWRYAGSGHPDVQNAVTQTCLVSNMEAKKREYMLYLSLYDGVEYIELGVPEGYALSLPEIASPDVSRPIVMYGTSILQGGCANRPGMAHTSILSRRLDMEVINLGFSGNAFLDYEVAELMAKVDNPAVFVLDYVPNASAEQIRDKGEGFVAVLRRAHPKVPVVLVEDPEFAHAIVDMRARREINKKNAAQRALFESLRAKGDANVYYVKAKGMIGEDGEATVDGVHFTDLGMERYVEHLLPVLRKALRKRR